MKKLYCFILILIVSLSTILFGCNSSEVYIYTPDGAPALSLSLAIKSDIKNANINIVSADKIASFVSGKEKKADICILPINVASKLIGSGDDYKRVGVITHGNFYFLSTSDIVIDKDNLSVLVGKTIGVMQLQNVPGLTLRSVLTTNNIEYKIIQDSSEKDEDKVNLMAINKVETMRTDIDVFLIPSPAADVKAQTTPLKFVGSLGEIYSENGFPQAIIAVKNSLLKENLKFVKEFINQVKNVDSYLKEENKAEICSLIKSKIESGLTPTFNENNLTSQSIIRSKIKFESALNSKENIEKFINDIKSIQPDMVMNLSENFYYLGTIWLKVLLKKT